MTKGWIFKTIRGPDSLGIEYKASVYSTKKIRNRTAPLTALVTAILCCLPAGAVQSPAPDQLRAELKLARQNVRENMTDGNAHFKLAEILRKSGRDREAAQEYLLATSYNHDLYVAYHELALVCDDQAELDEGITRLNGDKESKPLDLMLRVALSELLEKRRDYRAAATVLVELQYANAVPAKYTQRVVGRVHFLLERAKHAEIAEVQPQVQGEQDLDIVPAPLPDAALRKGLTGSKIKDSKELKGLGNVPLLP